MPTETITPSIGVPDARFFGTMPEAELQVPKVAIHEHRVEFDRAAFFEQVLQLGDMTVEHVGGHLAAAADLGPIAGVRGRGHDLGIHGGRGSCRAAAPAVCRSGR